MKTTNKSPKLNKSRIDSTTYKSWQQDQVAVLEKKHKAGDLTQEDLERKRDHVLNGYPSANGVRQPMQLILWDHEVKGLGLRITPNDVRTWVLSYRVHGRKHIMKVGRFGQPLTLPKARRKAIRELGRIDDGNDPLEEKRAQQREAAEAKTVSELCDTYLDRHAVNNKSEATDRSCIEYHIRPKLGRIRLDGLTRVRVQQFYREIGATAPYQANRTLGVLSSMWNLADEWGFVAEGSPNPAKMSKKLKFRGKRRERPITSEEKPRLLAAIDAEPDPYIRVFFTVLLLTGLRKNELLEAKRADLDPQRQTLRLPDTKAGKPRHKWLPSAAVDLLLTLPLSVSSHLFPSPRLPGEPRYDVRTAWDRIRANAEVEDLRIHDIRHSVATWLADEGVPAQTIQQALGHADIAQTMGYVHSSDQASKEALEALAGKILEVKSE